jgi:hypothetical protein
VTEKASLEGSLAKLGRAHHHLECLYSSYNRDVAPQTHDLTRYDGDEPGTYIFKAEGLPKLPSDWSLIVGDFAHNLRSALDHLVWQLVILSGLSEPGRDNQFPICKSGTRYWCSRKKGEAPSVRDRTLRGVAEKYRTPIDAAQPYRRGTSPEQTFLAGLDDLSNFDKHRVIQAAFTAVLELTKEDFIVVGSDEGSIVKVAYEPWQRLEDGAEVIRVEVMPPDAKVRMKAGIPIAIGFGETGVAIAGLGPLYEFVRDFIKWWRPAFEGQDLPSAPYTQTTYTA